jgi:hypothetical protein
MWFKLGKWPLYRLLPFFDEVVDEVGDFSPAIVGSYYQKTETLLVALPLLPYFVGFAIPKLPQS